MNTGQNSGASLRESEVKLREVHVKAELCWGWFWLGHRGNLCTELPRWICSVRPQSSRVLGSSLIPFTSIEYGCWHTSQEQYLWCTLRITEVLLAYSDRWGEQLQYK